jgi:hypothetical protein
MTSTLDGLDARAKAAAILSGRKLQMLEDAGLTVVDKRRLEALEELYRDVKELTQIPPRIDHPAWKLWELDDKDMAVFVEDVQRVEATEREG